MNVFRNFDYANLYYDFETSVEYNEMSKVKINGWYKLINGQMSALYVNDNCLFFLLGENKIHITDNYTVIISSGKNEHEKEFFLYMDKINVAKFLYSVPKSDLNISPFEYIDVEDFKWGDFIEKIINYPDRKRNFISNLME